MGFVGNAPNELLAIFGHQKGTFRRHRNADHATIDLLARGVRDEPRKKGLWFTSWSAVTKRNKNDLIAAPDPPILRAVLCNKGTMPVSGRKLLVLVKSKLQWRNMRAQEHVWREVLAAKSGLDATRLSTLPGPR